MSGWPPCDAVFPAEDPFRSVESPVFAVGLRGFPQLETSERGGREYPITAFEVSGASLATPTGFRMMEHLATKNYQVRAANNRPIQVEGEHDRRMSVRLGPSASGEGANYVQSARRAPPALRETSVRALFSPLSVPVRVSSLPTMNAGALLGF